MRYTIKQPPQKLLYKIMDCTDLDIQKSNIYKNEHAYTSNFAKILR